MIHRPLFHRRIGAGFTLIELMVVIAVMALIITLAAPSFQRLIQMQRLRSITAKLVTDLQFARAEAVQRNTLVRLSFLLAPNALVPGASSCYTIYTAPVRDPRCDCTLGPGAACPAGYTELRTVQIPGNLAVQIGIPTTEFDTAFAFDNVTGGLWIIPTDDPPSPFDGIRINSAIDVPRALAIKINRSGRPTVCSPALSTMTEPAC